MNTIMRNEQGGAAVEMGIALPVLVTFIYAIFQVGLVFQANAGVQHALGEAAREATIHPMPSDVELAEIIQSKRFGTHNGTLKSTTIATNADAGGGADGSRTITLTYAQPTDLIFFDGPEVEIVQSKTLYTAIGGGAVGTTSCAYDADGDMQCKSS